MVWGNLKRVRLILAKAQLNAWIENTDTFSKHCNFIIVAWQFYKPLVNTAMFMEKPVQTLSDKWKPTYKLGTLLIKILRVALYQIKIYCFPMVNDYHFYDFKNFDCLRLKNPSIWFWDLDKFQMLCNCNISILHLI